MGQPQIKIASAELVRSAGMIGLAVVTGGLSIVGQNVLSMSRSGRSPCQQVLQGR